MNLLFIQTGGTIDKDYPRATKGWAFEISDPAVERILERIKPSFKYKIVSLLKKDSQEITDEDRELILKTCLQEEADRIVITHGTDTMIETAHKLAIIKDKTIVLTGSMKPERFKDNDADFNVGTAIGAVESLPNGVYVAMHGRVLPYDKTLRELSTGQFVEKE
jgi:L-asparaginase